MMDVDENEQQGLNGEADPGVGTEQENQKPSTPTKKPAGGRKLPRPSTPKKESSGGSPRVESSIAAKASEEEERLRQLEKERKQLERENAERKRKLEKLKEEEMATSQALKKGEQSLFVNLSRYVPVTKMNTSKLSHDQSCPLKCIDQFMSLAIVVPYRSGI